MILNHGNSFHEFYRKFPCRKKQIDRLHEILGQDDEPLPGCFFVHGQPAVGKTTILLEYLKLRQIKYAYVNCVECYTHRLLHESIISQLFDGSNIKCDNLMDLVHHLKLLSSQCLTVQRYIIVLDGIEYLKELSDGYISAFHYLQELVENWQLCVIFISHILPEKFVIDGSLISVYFPQYSKDELIEILKFTKPEFCQDNLYDNYLNSALSIFLRTTRDLNEMKFLISSNFDHYYEPIKNGTCSTDNVSSLWRNVLPHFKSSLNTVYSGLNSQSIERFQYDPQKNEVVCNKGPSVLDLPYYAKYFLIAAYLASYNSPKHDRRLFLKNHGKKKKRLTNKQVKEKLTLELLGPKAFPLDRLLAIFYAIMEEKASLTVNLVTQISTLVELRLLARIGETNIDRPKFKCLVGLESIESVARTLGFNIKKYLLD
uniref:Origin recognition complex subunit n=1 Tax=Riptortus pedestris TaxID=329032 RepID=R4WE09_RIPPE|nr:origin recognition complex subunit [Riptortus pedestris]